MTPALEADLPTLLRWLAIDSTSGREAPFLLELEAHFTAGGWRATRQRVTDDRWNLWLLPEGEARLLFCTHVDTVPPHIDGSRDGDLIRGRGACDTKGGLFAMWLAARDLPAELRQQVGFVLVVGEEVDHIGAIVAAESPLARPACIVMCEPTTNLQGRGQRGILKVRLTSTGQEGHSAFPEAGRSAVPPLLHALERLEGHRWPSHPVLGETTYNIGLLHAGVAANVFAPRAEAELLFRAVSDPTELLEQVRQLVGSDVEVTRLASNPPVLLATVDGIGDTVIPFNTDAPYLQHLCPIMLVGPGDIRCAHAPGEHIHLSDLSTGISLYREVATRILTGDLPRVR